ncbi:MAG: hypothetical protein QMB62_12510 [Oscillospiraceae bacterium]
MPIAGVRDVEDIAERKLFVAVVDQRDTLRSAINPPTQLFVPKLDGRAGRGVRTLRIDQDLLRKRIFIVPRHCTQKGRPVFICTG